MLTSDIRMELEKVYEPLRFEPHWAQWWIASGIYQAQIPPEGDSNTAPVFSLVIPPPNVTGSLHIGHMLDHATMDVAVRWHRMMGELTLWLPGTDHAGIATQMVVERQLAKEGLSRQALGREEFERRVWQWKEQYGGRIQHQIEREGASVDWSRERFTMDPGLSKAVRETFVRLWEAGLIYRGNYMVNWCPDCHTAISDVETIHEPELGHLWHVRYPLADSSEVLEVATTRPETMLGDTALAVHPTDERYRHLQGRVARLPLVGRDLPIIADEMVDPAFGTGVVKITPAHDPQDFEAGKRHNLPSVKVIGEDGRMTSAAGRFAGLDRFEARKRVIAALEEEGTLARVEAHTVNLSRCDRSKTIIEPLVSTQWFVRMKPLAEQAVAAVRAGRIRFVPDDRLPVFYQWMDNIRDWCISRQLWWGHRIPAWHCRDCHQLTVARETPAVCSHCRSTEVVQDADVLDTWFSSGLWPFSTLGWPADTIDLRTFYPTSLLITGFDILFFWVARMIMLGLWCTGDVPFREVHMHGLVRDAERKKMSKTKGNVVDPLDLIERYGTDASRLALLISASPGSDIALKEDRLTSARSFANKLWNASRLIFLNLERSGVRGWRPEALPELARAVQSSEDRWIFSRLLRLMTQVNHALVLHRYQEAGQALWDFVWHDFCDWYLEVKKQRFEAGSGLNCHWSVLLGVYETTLRLLHPFLPFVTEELWQRLVHGEGQQQAAKSISLASYPTPVETSVSEAEEREFGELQAIVTAARELRADHKLKPKEVYSAALHLNRDAPLSGDTGQIIETLAKVRLTGKSLGADGNWRVLRRATPEFTLEMVAPCEDGDEGRPAADSEFRQRLERETASLEQARLNLERQLASETFLSKAPPRVVAEMRTKVDEYREQIEKNKVILGGDPVAV